MSLVQINSPSCINFIKKTQYNFFLNIGAPRKISNNFLNHTKRGIINVHPSLINQLRGSQNPEYAFRHNYKKGITAHLMTKEYDYGPIIKQIILERASMTFMI